MPFWKKKEAEGSLPHVEPGKSGPQSSEPNPCPLKTIPSPPES